MSHETWCWCGNTELERFSDDYLRCAACETLVVARMPAAEDLLVHDDALDFYGQQYFKRMAEEHGFPPIEQRARLDLPERCIHWLRSLLRYKLPPGDVLELGSAHGGFVALTRWAGFDATGLDLSPWLVNLARETFDVPMLVGPVESQDIAAGSLDAIVLMDVLEHLGNPAATLSHCLNLLKPGGIFLVQTPRYREGKSLLEMESENDPFLGMLKPDQHLYLFSQSSLTRLLQGLGAGCVSFEPAIFGSYDMALVAGREVLTRHSDDEVASRLQSRACSRMPLALLDLNGQTRDFQARLLKCEADSALRLQNNEVLTTMVTEDALTLRRVRGSHVVRLMRTIGLWQWLDSPASRPDPVLNRKRGLNRVVVDLTPVLPGGENGGAKVFAIELIRHLGRAAGNCEFILLTSDKTHDELESLDSTNVRRICVNEPRDLGRSADSLVEKCRRLLSQFVPVSGLAWLSGAYRRLARKIPFGVSLVRELDADLLFCPFTAPFFGDPSVPTVSVIYDLQHIYYPQFFESTEILERNRNFNRACSVSTRIVCISEYVRHTVLETGAATPEHVKVIRILLPRRLGAPSTAARERVLDSLQLQPRRYLLYPANFWAHKNHELLLTAFGMYRASNPSSDLKLVLTGSPSRRREELIEACSGMKLSGAVVFPGYIATEDFSTLMEQCLALIFPSLYEGFGMPLLEAMAARRPILCGTCASLPEVAGDAALFFNPMKPAEIVEAISRIEQDHDLERHLIEKGTRRLSALGGPEDMAADYLRIFHEAINQYVDLPPAMSGVFDDGWVGERLTVTFGESIDQRDLVMKLSLPEWAPPRAVTVRFTADGLPSVAYTIRRGEAKEIGYSLSRSRGFAEILCSPTFQPNACGMGEDSRALSCKCLCAEIVSVRGTALALIGRTDAV